MTTDHKGPHLERVLIYMLHLQREEKNWRMFVSTLCYLRMGYLLLFSAQITAIVDNRIRIFMMTAASMHPKLFLDRMLMVLMVLFYISLPLTRHHYHRVSKLFHLKRWLSPDMQIFNTLKPVH